MLGWKAILSKLRDEVSDDAFLLCLAVLQAQDDGETLVLLAPNAYIREEVVKTHLERILRASGRRPSGGARWGTAEGGG